MPKRFYWTKEPPFTGLFGRAKKRFLEYAVRDRDSRSGILAYSHNELCADEICDAMNFVHNRRAMTLKGASPPLPVHHQSQPASQPVQGTTASAEPSAQHRY